MIQRLLSLFVVMPLVGAAHAAADGEQKAREAIHALLPSVVIDRVVPSALPGFYEVVIDGQIAYVSPDGKYLLQGNLYDVARKKDLTAARIAEVRRQALGELPVSKQIVFAPPRPRYTVTVFTDIDCPYCRQFHKQIAEYNALGIAVHYVLFPLDIHPGAERKAVAVWCAKDRNAAYTAAMNGQDPGETSCTNPVAETKALGLRLGINATPTVLAADGSAIDNGKVAVPAELFAELERKAAAGQAEHTAKAQ
jgi:thiol:disulfide interchange protein DsbC